MRTFPKFHLLTLLLFVVSLAGCQSSSVKQSNVTRIDIEGNSLSRISDMAQVQLFIYSGDKVLEQADFSGLERLPFAYVPKLEQGNEQLTARVSVLFGGVEVLQGKTAVLPKQSNTLTLEPLSVTTREETYWKAVDIAGRGIPPDVSTTIALRTQGTITGFAGCNQYRGHYQAVSSFIAFNEIETTSNICANPVMYHENRYFKFLKSVEIFKVTDEQLLLYTSESDQPIVFTSVDKQEMLLSLRKTAK